jgi:predicted phosphodiesterase
MKIALLGDIHGNLPAFETVIADLERWSPDVIISTGDVINRGPSSAPCLALTLAKVRTHGWRTLRGNHEDYVIFQASPDAPREGPAFEAYRQSWWTLNELGGDVSAVCAWEDMVELPTPGGLLRVAHGTVHTNTRGMFPGMTAEELLEAGGSPAPAVFCAGHIHHPFVRYARNSIYFNVGSVGMPFDGDWRASYGRLTWQGGHWLPQIIRLEYDRERAIRDYSERGFLTGAGPMALLVLAEQLHSRPQLFHWQRDFFDEVMAGRRTVEAAVIAQLRQQGLWEEIRQYL